MSDSVDPTYADGYRDAMGDCKSLIINWVKRMRKAGVPEETIVLTYNHLHELEQASRKKKK